MIEMIYTSFAAWFLYNRVANEGLLGKVFEDLFGENATKVVERTLHSLRDALRAGTLPTNHDLRRASLDSLRNAGLVLANALACELDPSLRREAGVARLRRSLTIANWITDGSGPKMAWVQRFAEALQDPAKLRVFEDTVLQIDADITKLLEAQVDLDLAAKLQSHFAKWVAEHVDATGKPEVFDRFLSEGWPVAEGRLTLYQAYCFLFREHLKHDQAVCNIFTVNTLTEIKNELRQLGQHRAIEADEVNSRIQEALTISLDRQLSGLHDTVKRGFYEIAAALQEITKKLVDLAPSTLPFFARV